MKNIDYYMELDYPVEIQRISEIDGGGFLASIPMLPGCMTDGATLEEAYENIKAAKSEWLESMLERGMTIDEPATHEEFSGKFMVRLPKSLHRSLVQCSKREGISLNQFVTNSLAFCMGRQEANLACVEETRATYHTGRRK